jgi:hypothetical protein
LLEFQRTFGVDKLKTSVEINKGGNDKSEKFKTINSPLEDVTKNEQVKNPSSNKKKYRDGKYLTSYFIDKKNVYFLI